MRNMGNIVGNVDDLRTQREARKNPPQYEAGQGDDLDWGFFDEEPAAGSSMDDSAFRGSGSDLSFNSPDINSLSPQQNTLSKEQLAKNLTSEEDKIFEAIGVVLKLLFAWSKDLLKAMKKGFAEGNPFFWAVYGKRVMWTGSILVVSGVLGLILSLVTRYFVGSFWLIIGGLLLLFIGLIIFGVNYDASREYVGDVDSGLYSNEDVSDFNKDDISDEWGNADDIDDSTSWEGFNEDYDNEDDDNEDGELFSIWGNLENDLDDTSEEQVEEAIFDEDINIESAIDNIRDIPAHTQTRQYLFEEYSKVLPLKNPDFAKLKQISENSDNFIIFDKILYDAALQVGTKEDKLPELLELRENQFIIQLKASRPSGLKEDDIAKEIANIYSKDDFGAVIHAGVYATTSSVGSSFIINIFKGENSFVTLADTYKEEKDFVLDPSIKMPIIIGVNELGRVHKFDAEGVYSYIFSGKPRSGKSWGVVSLVLQLCMYNSPKEVTMEALDRKGTDSDYCSMMEYLPHFKNFEDNPARILSRLRYLTTVEAGRRKKILKDNGVLNIADLKKKGSDVEISYHYIIIDEMYGLKEVLSKNKNDYNEFKGLVNTVVTQMPNLGFRMVLVPHRITNDVIPKTTYTLVGFTACVLSEFREISNALEVTAKEFPYTLCVKGDMALKTSEVNMGKAVFNHGIAITGKNEDNLGIYRFVGSLWNKLEPEEIVEDVKDVEKYTGHNLEGVDDILKDGDFTNFDSSVDEDFWQDVLRENE